jgi:hypothetical protein
MRFLNITKISLSGELSSGWSTFEQAGHAIVGLIAELNTARITRRIQFGQAIFRIMPRRTSLPGMRC